MIQESKEGGQREELGAKTRAVEDFFKELEIGTKIEEQLQSETIKKLVVSAEKRVKTAFSEANEDSRRS